jgi:hypothetical protein
MIEVFARVVHDTLTYRERVREPPLLSRHEFAGEHLLDFGQGRR